MERFIVFDVIKQNLNLSNGMIARLDNPDYICGSNTSAAIFYGCIRSVLTEAEFSQFQKESTIPRLKIMEFGNMDISEILPGYLLVLNTASVIVKPLIRHEEGCDLDERGVRNLNWGNVRTVFKVRLTELLYNDQHKLPAAKKIPIVCKREL